MRVFFQFPAFVVMTIFVLITSSCTLERLFSDDVANGIARLSVNNFGNLLSALHNLPSQDTRPECNFRSISLTDKTTVHHDADGRGSVSWEFQNCEFDFGPEGKTVDSSNTCGPQKATFYGKVMVSGRRTISGILTGYDETPVIPSGPEGIEFNFSKVAFQNYRVESSGIDKAMTIVTGSASFDARIHLGKSRELKLCEIPLPNLTISNIQYSPGTGSGETIVRLPGPLGEFQAVVDGSNFQAQVGVYQGQSNQLEGTLSVWGKKITIPTDDPVLNPSFTVKSYEESLACMGDLQAPVADHCPYEAELATGIGRLTVNNLGNLIRAVAVNQVESVDKRAECNLGSLAIDPSKVSKIDRNNSELTWDFKNCEYNFGRKGTPLTFEGSTDGPTQFYGRVILSGKRRISGFLTGNKENPVIPGKGGVDFTFSEVRFDNYRVVSPGTDKSLTNATGRVSFELNVHYAKSRETNLCTVPLPNLTFTNIKYLEESNLILSGKFGDFKLLVGSSNFNAQVYRFRDKENHLEGSLNILGSSVTIPTDDPSLVPASDYKAADYEDILAGMPDLQTPLSYDCDSFEKVENQLADGVARLTVNNLGGFLFAVAAIGVSSADNREECRIGLRNVVAGRQIIEHGQGLGEVIWSFKDCVYDFSKYGNGKVSASGTRRLQGFLTGNDEEPIIPNGNGLEFKFDKVNFDNYKVSLISSTPPSSTPTLTIKAGSISFDVIFHLAKSEEYGVCMVPVLNPSFRNIKYSKGSLLVLSMSEGKLKGDSSVIVDGSDFDAQVAEFGDQINQLSGTLNIFGTSVLVPSDGKGLMPDYLGKQFQDSLAATRDLHMPLSYDCGSFTQVEEQLADGAARLSVSNLGSLLLAIKGVASAHARPECRLSSFDTPPKVENVSQGLGEAVWNFENCEFDFKEGTIVGDTTFKGKVTLSGQRRIYGLLTGDTTNPVIPGTRGIDFIISRAVFNNYRVEAPQRKAMTIESGSASFNINVHLAKNPDTQLFMDPQENPTITKIKYLEKAVLVLPGPFGDFKTTVDGSDFDAQVGTYGRLENHIEGKLHIFGKTLSVPSDKKGLDPEQVMHDQRKATHESDVFEEKKFELADGVARLSVNNLGSLLLAVTQNNRQHLRPQCNLGARNVMPGITKFEANKDPARKGQGTFILDFVDCEYNFGNGVTIGDTTFKGTVKVSGQRRFSGFLTGNDGTPVIPDDKGIEFEFTKVAFDNYSVEARGIDYALTFESGNASFKVIVHLAKSKENGVCEIPLENLTLSDIRLDRTKISLSVPYGKKEDNKKLLFKTTIDASNINAQVYRFQNHENQLSGSLQIFGSSVNVPTDAKGLKPGFVPGVWEDSLALTPDLHLPISFDCGSFDGVEHQLADGAARLTVNNLGNLLNAMKETAQHPRPECRLASLEGTPTFENLSNGLGEAVWNFNNCEYDFKNGVTSGNVTFKGKVTLSGQRRIFGLLTGDATNPIIPGTRGINFIFSRAVFQNYKVEAAGRKAMTIESGSASFEINVHLAKNPDTKLFTDPKENPTISKIRYLEPTHLILPGPFGDFKTTVDGSDFKAQVAKFGSHENHLEGTLHVFGKTLTVPSDNKGLDPEQPTHTQLSVAHESDGFEERKNELADGITRLTVNNLGNLLLAATDSTRPHTRAECNLGARSVLPGITTIEKSLDSHLQGQGEFILNFNNCEYDFGAGVTIGDTTFKGKVSLTGTRKFSGFLTGNDGTPVIPDDKGIQFNITKVSFDNYRVESPSLEYVLTLESGTASFGVVVHLAKSASNDVCEIPLRNLTFRDINLAKTNVSLSVPYGKKEEAKKLDFKTSMEGVISLAQVDRYHYKNLDHTNQLEGTLQVFGKTVHVPTDHKGLKPDFNIRAFEDGLAATPDLKLPLSYDCASFAPVEHKLADGAARLTVNNLGNVLIGAKAFANHPRPECRLASLEGNPRFENVTDGLGEAVWDFADCEYNFGASTNVAGTIFSGKVTLTGQRRVFGLLTGDAVNPVMPGTRGIEFIFSRATFSNYRVEAPDRLAMTIESGSASFDVNVHLAKNPVTKLFMDPQENPTITNVQYLERTHLVLPGPFGDFKTTVDGSNFSAQVGSHKHLENHIEGTFNIFGKSLIIPSDKKGLDPEQPTNKHRTAVPEGEIFDEKKAELADGVARLTINNLGNLLRAIALNDLASVDKREECKLGGRDVLAGRQINRHPNGQGDIVWTFANCSYDFGALVQNDPNATKFYGKVTLSGTRRVTGFLTGNDTTPVIPSDRGFEFRFDRVAFDHYKVESPDLNYILTLESGSAAFDVTVHLAKSLSNDVCEKPLENLTFSNIRYLEKSLLTLSLPFGSLKDPKKLNFKLSVNASNMHAQVHRFQNHENHLSGTLHIFGKSFNVPADHKGLNPDFAPGVWEDSLANVPDLKLPVSYDCGSFDTVEHQLADGAARLTINNFGNMLIGLKAFADHPRVECRLNALVGKPRFENVSHGLGEAVWDFENCEYDFGAGTTVENIRFKGKVTLSGQRRVHGLLTGDANNPVIPGTRGIDFLFKRAVFNNYRVEAGQRKAMTIESGSASFDVNVHLAKNPKTNLFMDPQSNPTLTNIKYLEKTHLVLPGPFGDFKTEVDGSHFAAQVAAYGHLDNVIDGTLHAFGKTLVIPSDKKGLDPDEPTNTQRAAVRERDIFDDKKAELADGIAQLTIFNLGNLLQALAVDKTPSVDNREECLLGAYDISAGRTIVEHGKGRGEVIWTFSNCTYDLGASLQIDPMAPRFFGKVTLSGTRRLAGFLTGNEGTPAIPGDSGFEFRFDKVIFDNYKVEDAALKNALTMESGSAAFNVTVHLAKSQKSDVCQIPLQNLTFSHIRYLEKSHLSISVPLEKEVLHFKTVVDSSNLQAQAYTYKDLENHLEGTLHIFGSTISVPTDGSGRLDPDFSVTKWDHLLAATADLKMPLSYDCDSLQGIESQLAAGAAQLTIKNLGSLLIAMTDSDVNLMDTKNKEECRIGVRAFARVPSKMHPISDTQGEITWDFADCEYDFGKNGTLVGDMEFFGKVKLTGRQRIVGFLTDNHQLPIIPGEGGIEFNFAVVSFDNFRAKTADGAGVLGLDQSQLAKPQQMMTQESGQLSYDVAIHLGRSKKVRELGMNLCIVPLQNATFKNIKYWPGSKVTLPGPFGDFKIRLDGSDFNAQVGDYESRENQLWGSLVIAGENIELGFDQLLDPDYNATRYWADLEKSSDLDVSDMYNCDSVERVLALNTARLLIQNLGAITQEGYDEYLKGKKDWRFWSTACGFSSNGVRANPIKVEGKAGSRGLIQFGVDNCEVINQSVPGEYPENCVGQKTVFKGKVTLSGVQTVEGERENVPGYVWGFYDGIIPRDPRATTLNLTKITADDFTAYYSDKDNRPPDVQLVLKSGTFSAEVKPILAANWDDPCRFERSTPVVDFQTQVKQDLAVVLMLHFEFPIFGQYVKLDFNRPLTVNSADIVARNGVYQGDGNFLKGHIAVNGVMHEFKREKLDPVYVQENFDKTYSCRKKAGSEYSIHEVIGWQEGWSPDCKN